MLAPTWLTSDLHIGHANIISYCDRPYGRVEGRPGFHVVTPAVVEEMNADLVRRWNAVVAPDDSVLVLGDLALGRLDDSLLYAAELNGAKSLLPGNHDRMFECQGTKYRRTCERYEAIGFEILWPDAVTVDLGDDYYVYASHFPYHGESRDGHEDRFADHRPTDRGGPLVHGHTHGAWRKRGHMVDVGVDAWGGSPVLAGAVRALFRQSQDRESLPWK